MASFIFPKNIDSTYFISLEEQRNLVNQGVSEIYYLIGTSLPINLEIKMYKTLSITTPLSYFTQTLDYTLQDILQSTSILNLIRDNKLLFLRKETFLKLTEPKVTQVASIVQVTPQPSENSLVPTSQAAQPQIKTPLITNTPTTGSKLNKQGKVLSKNTKR